MFKVVSTDTDYRIVGNKEVIREINAKYDSIPVGLRSLTLLLQVLGIKYEYMSWNSIYHAEYADGDEEMLISATECSVGPSDFIYNLIGIGDKELEVYYWSEVEGLGYFTNDKDRLVRNVEYFEILPNEETIDYVNGKLQESDSFRNLHFDTIEDLKEWYDKHEEQAIDEGVELQIAEYKDYSDWYVDGKRKDVFIINNKVYMR